MHEINDVIVRDGRIELTHLPFNDGQHVHVIVSETLPLPSVIKIPIADVRKMLKGSIERFDQPFEPMIPSNDW